MTIQEKTIRYNTIRDASGRIRLHRHRGRDLMYLLYVCMYVCKKKTRKEEEKEEEEENEEHIQAYTGTVAAKWIDGSRDVIEQLALHCKDKRAIRAGGWEEGERGMKREREIEREWANYRSKYRSQLAGIRIRYSRYNTIRHDSGRYDTIRYDKP